MKPQGSTRNRCPLAAMEADAAGAMAQGVGGIVFGILTPDGSIARTRCRQIHVAAFTTRRDDSTRNRPAVTFGGALFPPENLYDITDRDVIARLSKRRDR